MLGDHASKDILQSQDAFIQALDSYQGGVLPQHIIDSSELTIPVETYRHGQYSVVYKGVRRGDIVAIKILHAEDSKAET